ncbi:MAG: ArsB/NhaD family transporter [Chloroflexi bacterium]|nr:ArsB/NhaD family transporter [Chloroflexota bacterium]
MRGLIGPATRRPLPPPERRSVPLVTEQLIAGGTFVAVYALIVSDRIHRTLAALLGASVVMILGVIPQHEAFEHVDFNVIFLLAGMMIIANVMAKTGVFQWLAVEAVRRAQGRPYRLLVFTAIITAVVSAFLDNVTTVVLLTPITFFIAQRLGASPVPFLISIVLASNIGGTATLVGDPPNILVGSAFDKDFNDFVLNLTPVVVVSLALYLVAARWIYRTELSEMITALEPEDIDRLVREERRIEDVPLMRKGLAVMGLTILGFIVARPLHLEAATIALAGAVVLMIVAKEDVHSAIVDNIPYTATMIPLVQEMKSTMDIEPVIWALVLGADFGGNATVIGASANVVVASMSESRGHPITFRGYLKYGVPATLLTMLVATADIWIRTTFFR